MCPHFDAAVLSGQSGTSSPQEGKRGYSMTIKPELIETLRNKRKRIVEHIAPEKLQTMHEKGMLSARERVDALFDEYLSGNRLARSPQGTAFRHEGPRIAGGRRHHRHGLHRPENRSRRSARISTFWLAHSARCKHARLPTSCAMLQKSARQSSPSRTPVAHAFRRRRCTLRLRRRILFQRPAFRRRAPDRRHLRPLCRRRGPIRPR